MHPFIWVHISNKEMIGMTTYIRVLSLPILLSFSLDSYSKSWLNESEHMAYEDIVAEHDEVFINLDLQNLISLNVEKNNTYKSNLKKMAYINSQLDKYIQDAKYSEDVDEHKLSNNIAKLIVGRSELSVIPQLIHDLTVIPQPIRDLN
jgi:hypothetical protein